MLPLDLGLGAKDYVPSTNVWGVQKIALEVESVRVGQISVMYLNIHTQVFILTSFSYKWKGQKEVTFIYGRFQISAKLVLHNAYCDTVLPLISAMNM